MRIGWREVLLIIEAAVFLYAGFCICRRRNEGAGKQETFNLWPFSLLILCCSLFLAGLTLIPDGWTLAVFALSGAYASLLISNCRVHWDISGFWYRTALGREVRYEYEDISRMRRTGSSQLSEDLLFRAGKRLICLDEMMGWERFAAAYDDWRTRNGLIPWREEEKRRWLDRYLRHGTFGRKLDRIPGGRLMLAFTLVTGVFFAAVGLAVLLTFHPDTPKAVFELVASTAMLLAGIAFPAGYIWGAAHMNKRVLHFYTKSRIRPDPLNPEKPRRYQKKKR